VAEFRVDVVSPAGETVVPLEVDPDELVSAPLTLVDFWLLVSVEVDDGRTTGGVVDWVVVELEDELCAKAVPVIKEATIVAASRVLIISNAPKKLSRAGIARWRLRWDFGSAVRRSFGTAGISAGRRHRGRT
jgi:hypothetical protein